MELTKYLLQAIKDYQAGQADAFEMIYELTKRELYAYVTYVMRGNAGLETICEDILQETYLSISKHLSQLEKEESFPAWSKKIAKSECMAYVKKNKKYLLLKEEDNTFDMLEDSDDIIPEEIVQSQEKQRLIREILETQLTEIQRICIYDFYYNNKKQSEIAADLEIPENTVKTHLSRAKMRIKEGVIDLEKKQDTKLYSVAPVFMLLFAEDVKAAQVPESVTRSVLSAVRAQMGATAGIGGNIVRVEQEVLSTAKAGAGAAKAGVTAAKAAAISLKTKIAASVVGLITVGTVGAVVVTNLDNQEESVKRSKKESDKKIEWNFLQDEDEQENEEQQGESDTHEEQIEVAEKDWASEEQYKYYTTILASIEEFYDFSGETEDVNFDMSEITSIDKMTIAAGIYSGNRADSSEHEVAVDVLGAYWNECTGESFMQEQIDNEFAEYAKAVNNYYHGYKYQEGMVDLAYHQWKRWERRVLVSDTYYPCEMTQEMQYADGVCTVIDKESGELLTSFTGIDEQEDYFIVSGRMHTYGNMPFEIYFYKTEENQRGYILDSVKYYGSQRESNEGNSEIKLPYGVEMTDAEIEAIEVLARFVNTRHWTGEDVNGVEENIDQDLALWFLADLTDINIWKVANSYDKYLPPKVEGVNMAYYKADVIKYIKDVFGLETTLTAGYHSAGSVNGDLYNVSGTQYSNKDRAILDEIEVRDGQYIVKGSISYGEYYDMNSSKPTYYDMDRFTLYLEKNPESPFGFTVSRLYYEDTKQTGFMGTEYQYRVLLQMKQAMDDACISHWQMSEDFELKVSDMTILSKLNFAASGYRYGWLFGKTNEAELEDLSSIMYLFTQTTISREDVDVGVAEMIENNYIYRGVKYRDGKVNLFTEEEIMPNPWGESIVSEYQLEEETGIYEGGTYRYKADASPKLVIQKVEEHGDRIYVYGKDHGSYNMPFVMKLKRSKYSPIGYVLESIYYSAGQSDLVKTGW